MIQFIKNYWKFISYDDSEYNNFSSDSGLDVMPKFRGDLIFFTILFSALFLSVPYFCRYFFSTWYSGLDKRKKKELPSYIVCLFHHISVVPTAWLHIQQDYFRILSIDQNDSLINYALLEGTVAPFCLAYLISDTLFYALPEAWNYRLEYLIHHILTIYLVWATINAPGEMNRFSNLLYYISLF